MTPQDYPLGSTFQHNGATFLVAENTHGGECVDCYFYDKSCHHVECTPLFRRERNHVRFVKIINPAK